MERKTKMSTMEMAGSLGISVYTLHKWRAQGCAIGERQGRTHYYVAEDRERILEWRRTALKARGRPRKTEEEKG